MKNIITTAIIALLSFGVLAQTYLTQVKVEKTWGYANEKGELVILPKYKKCFPFSEGFAAVLDGKKYMFIKADGSQLETEIDGFGLNKKSRFSDGMVQIKVGKQWGYMDTEGKMVIKPAYLYASPFENGFAIVKKETTFLIIDKTGTETKIDIADIKKIDPFSEGLASVTNLSGKTGYMDYTGTLIIDTKFFSVGNFKNGYAWAKNDMKQLGYINKNGEWISEPKFASGKNFDKISGLARVKYNEQWAYVSQKGDVVYVKNTSVWGDFNDGLSKGKEGELLGFYDNTGTYKIKPQFEAVRNFKNGFAAVKLKGKWGVINLEGEWIIEPKYMGIKDMELIPN